MCLGALFLPDDGPTNSQLESIKDRHRQFAPGHSFSDIKYSKSGDRYVFAVCKEVIDLFASQPAWFRALVIDSSRPDFSWMEFGGRGMPRNLTKARAYNRLVGLLLGRNLEGITDAVLLADSLTAMAGDDFIQYISELFGFDSGLTQLASVSPRIRNVQRVDTSLPGYQLGQMCDVLLGVVTGDLVHPTNRNKLALIQYAKDTLGIASFGPEYWLGALENQLNEPPSKFHVWHWRKNL